MKRILFFLDKIHDNKIRGFLAKHPFVYALLGAIGVVLLWRGIWHTADTIPFLNGPVSTVIGLLILLLTGAFVSSFISNRLIITGIKGEKLLSEKSIDEIEDEEKEIEKSTDKMEDTLNKIQMELNEIKEEIKEEQKENK